VIKHQPTFTNVTHWLVLFFFAVNSRNISGLICSLLQTVICKTLAQNISIEDAETDVVVRVVRIVVVTIGTTQIVGIIIIIATAFNSV